MPGYMGPSMEISSLRATCTFPSETPKSIKEFIKEKYLLPGLDPDEFSQKKLLGSGNLTGLTEQKFAWSHHCPALLSFLHGNYLSDVQRGSLKNGNLARCRWDVSELTAGAEDSGALPRISGPATDFVKGSINNHPFRRRGLGDSESFGMMLPDGASNGEWVWEMLNGGPAQAIPPSFKDGHSSKL